MHTLVNYIPHGAVVPSAEDRPWGLRLVSEGPGGCFPGCGWAGRPLASGCWGRTEPSHPELHSRQKSFQTSLFRRRLGTRAAYEVLATAAGGAACPQG